MIAKSSSVCFAEPIKKTDGLSVDQFTNDFAHNYIRK